MKPNIGFALIALLAVIPTAEAASNWQLAEPVDWPMYPRLEEPAAFPQLPDPTPFCREKFTDVYVQEECIKQNQDGYNVARTLWPKMSAHTTSWCAKLVTTSFEPLWKYKALGDCALEWYYGYDVPRQPAEPFDRW